MMLMLAMSCPVMLMMLASWLGLAQLTLMTIALNDSLHANSREGLGGELAASRAARHSPGPWR